MLNVGLECRGVPRCAALFRGALHFSAMCRGVPRCAALCSDVPISLFSLAGPRGLDRHPMWHTVVSYEENKRMCLHVEQEPSPWLWMSIFTLVFTVAQAGQVRRHFLAFRR